MNCYLSPDECIKLYMIPTQCAPPSFRKVTRFQNECRPPSLCIHLLIHKSGVHDAGTNRKKRFMG